LFLSSPPYCSKRGTSRRGGRPIAGGGEGLSGVVPMPIAM
jgi:hypothetical protein